MSDIIDRACEVEMLQRDAALETYSRLWEEDHTSASHYCLDCGEIIPEARRIALPGCARCVDCQEFSEYRRRQRAKQ